MTAILIVCALLSQADAAKEFEGAWYGWACSLPVELKLHFSQAGIDGSLKAVAPSYLQKVSDETIYLVKHSLDRAEIKDGHLTFQATAKYPNKKQFEEPPCPSEIFESVVFVGTFHFEGRVLMGELSTPWGECTVALARSVPDAEEVLDQTETVSPKEYVREWHKGISLNNLKLLGIIFQMYADEHEGLYPAIDMESKELIFAKDVVYPEYVTDSCVVVSPANSEHMEIARNSKDDESSDRIWSTKSYWYLGYVIQNPSDSKHFLRGIREVLLSDSPPPDILKVRDQNSGEIIASFPRFKKSDDLWLEHRIPVMIERPSIFGNGASVLFMDGHTEFLEYPELSEWRTDYSTDWPLTPQFIEGLVALDNLSAGDIAAEEEASKNTN